MASFFEQIIKKLLPTQPNTHQPLVTEVLKRSQAQLEKYNEWQSDQQHLALIESIAKAYYLRQQNMKPDLSIHIFESPYANGFAITYDEQHMGKNDLMFLSDYFKDMLLPLEYTLKSAQREITDKATYISTVERYYLKPESKQAMSEGKLINQLYGNLLLENVWVDEKPSYLKVLSTIYADRSFTPALKFDDLVQILFQLNQ
ncbi:hypothetical protein [Microscilla marina]|nr:hypothetical protein [Microscilla marina]